MSPTRPKSFEDIVSKKHLGKPTSVFGTRTEVKLYYKDTKAQVQLIWAEKDGSNDGFLNDLFMATNDTNSSVRKMGLIHVSNRRLSKEQNIEVLNGRNTWPRKYFCRYIPPTMLGDHIESLHDQMETFLTKITVYLNGEEKKKAPKRMEDDEKKGKPPSRNEGIWNHFTVAPNFDQTPVTVTALDHYLLDDDVVGLIKTLFENDDGMWSNWGIYLLYTYPSPRD